MKVSVTVAKCTKECQGLEHEEKKNANKIHLFGICLILELMQHRELGYDIIVYRVCF